MDLINLQVEAGLELTSEFSKIKAKVSVLVEAHG